MPEQTVNVSTLGGAPDDDLKGENNKISNKGHAEQGVG